MVEKGQPFGLINRHIFLSQMSRPFYRERYDKKSCIAFMDKNPLIVDANASLNTVADQTVISGDKSLTDGFIITRDGTYLGIGLGIDLIKAVSDMHQHQQVMQSIEYASIIQQAMMSTSSQAMSATLSDGCLAWQPRDCVGGDCYAFKTTADGLTDQVGGERRIMYGKRRLQAALLNHRALPMPALAQQLQPEHQRYQGQQPRRDDLTFWGLRQ